MRRRNGMVTGVIGMVAGFAVVVTAQVAENFDWPQFRGPNRDGISKETKWNPKALEGGAKALWKANVGKGWSAVSICDGKALTMGNENDQDSVIALGAKDGKEIWRHKYACKAADYPGPRATPTTDGKVVYTLARSGQLFCLDIKDGKVKWQKNVISDFNLKNTTWNLAGSPVIEDDLLLINAGEHGVALNRQTGAKVWTSAAGPGGYSTPVVYKNGGKQCVALFGCKNVYGVDLKTGNKLWSSSWETKYDVNAADPIVLDGKMFISSGYDRGCSLLDVKGAQPKTIWTHKNMRNHFSSCVLINGYLYGIDGNAGNGSLKCMDFATGTDKWSKPLGFGGLMAAGEHLIVLNEKGDLFIGKFSPTGFEESSSAKGILGLKCWTAPVLANGIIYCRNNEGDVVAIDASK